MIEQAIRDYFNLSRSIVPIEVQYFESAAGFLFDDDYLFRWGDYEISLENVLDYLHIDIDWFRSKLLVVLER